MPRNSNCHKLPEGRFVGFWEGAQYEESSLGGPRPINNNCHRLPKREIGRFLAGAQIMECSFGGRGSQEQPGAARSSQEQPRTASS